MADIRRAEGVVIKRGYFSDTSLIVTFYTDRFGKVRLLAKGARRIGSPVRGRLDLFMLSSILFYYGRSDLHILKECETVESHMGIRENLDRVAAASYIVEIADGLTATEDSNRILYAWIVQSLDAIQTSGKAVPLAACFALKLLVALGNFPQYENCAKCAAELGSKRFFDGKAFRCAGCSSASTRLSAGTVRILDHIFSYGSSGVRTLSPSKDQLKELIAISSRIFEAESGRKLRTRLTI